jgi:hypothetical protein
MSKIEPDKQYAGTLPYQNIIYFRFTAVSVRSQRFSVSCIFLKTYYHRKFIHVHKNVEDDNHMLNASNEHFRLIDIGQRRLGGGGDLTGGKRGVLSVITTTYGGSHGFSIVSLPHIEVCMTAVFYNLR